MCHGTDTNRYPSIFLTTSNKISVYFTNPQVNVLATTIFVAHKKYTVTLVVKNNTIYLYINGINEKELKLNTDLVWDTSERINNTWIWNKSNEIVDSVIKISNVNWWNIALSESDVANFYKTVPDKFPLTEQTL